MSLLTIYEAINIGCYILIATVYKGATRECKGYSDTLFGDIVPEYGLLSVRDSCGMQRATFALSIVVVILSGCSVLLEILYFNHRGGPPPPYSARA
ncbi:hypothetical protein HDV63DRAFT_370985 [Trichoderma sp. SZMC 28014]